MAKAVRHPLVISKSFPAVGSNPVGGAATGTQYPTFYHDLYLSNYIHSNFILQFMVKCYTLGVDTVGRDVPVPGGAGRACPALLLAARYKTKKVQVPPGRNFY